MKLCRFKIDDAVFDGVIESDVIYAVSDGVRSNQALDPSEVTMLSPAVPSKIVCVGRNYAEHAKELGNEVPTEPLLFLKAPSAVIGSGDAIVIPSQSGQVEHEGELAIIIGRTCKDLGDDEDPLGYVHGYTCLNDVTARDLQRKDVQFTRAKSFDTFCPIGPHVENELDVSDIRVTTTVNGIVKQDGRTSQMVFPIPFLVRYISRQMTLNEGDVIATGTPSGVSKLNAGDVCEVTIEGIGTLRNEVKGGGL